jgi:hypothetical protein
VLGCVGKVIYWAKFKKTNNNNLLKKKFGFDDLKWNYSKCNFSKNLKKLQLNNNNMMYVWWFLLKLFFLLIFKDCPLENFDRFLKIAPPFICLNTSMWTRWKGIFKSKIQKIKKPNNNIFFFLSWFETELLKIYIFIKSKKITNEQQLYDVCSVQVVSGACTVKKNRVNFVLWIIWFSVTYFQYIFYKIILE